MHTPPEIGHVLLQLQPFSLRPNMAWSGSEFEESMTSTRTQTTSRNLQLQTYTCAAELATWGVGPDVNKHKINLYGQFPQYLLFVL